MKDLHHEAIKEYGDIMVWEELVAEGYCVLNPDCKVAKATDAKTDLTEDDVIAYARMAENYFKLPIFYLEYSGTYGDIDSSCSCKGSIRGNKAILRWWHYVTWSKRRKWRN